MFAIGRHGDGVHQPAPPRAAQKLGRSARGQPEKKESGRSLTIAKRWLSEGYKPTHPPPLELTPSRAIAAESNACTLSGLGRSAHTPARDKADDLAAAEANGCLKVTVSRMALMAASPDLVHTSSGASAVNE